MGGFAGIFYQPPGHPALTGGGLNWGPGDRHYGGCGGGGAGAGCFQVPATGAEYE